MSTRRRTSWRLRLPLGTLARMAPEIWPLHADFVSTGWRLLPSSGMWRRANGTFTARLAYRCEGRASLVVNITDIIVEDPEEAV